LLPLLLVFINHVASQRTAEAAYRATDQCALTCMAGLVADQRTRTSAYRAANQGTLLRGRASCDNNDTYDAQDYHHQALLHGHVSFSAV
jgi:hypothetical protein